MQNLGQIMPRECEAVLRPINVIARSDLSAVARRAKAEATRQSSLSYRRPMNCFATRYARNDGDKPLLPLPNRKPGINSHHLG